MSMARAENAPALDASSVAGVPGWAPRAVALNHLRDVIAQHAEAIAKHTDDAPLAILAALVSGRVASVVTAAFAVGGARGAGTAAAVRARVVSAAAAVRARVAARGGSHTGTVYARLAGATREPRRADPARAARTDAAAVVLAAQIANGAFVVLVAIGRRADAAHELGGIVFCGQAFAAVATRAIAAIVRGPSALRAESLRRARFAGGAARIAGDARSLAVARAVGSGYALHSLHARRRSAARARSRAACAPLAPEDLAGPVPRARRRRGAVVSVAALRAPATVSRHGARRAHATADLTRANAAREAGCAAASAHRRGTGIVGVQVRHAYVDAVSRRLLTLRARDDRRRCSLDAPVVRSGRGARDDRRDGADTGEDRDAHLGAQHGKYEIH